MSPAYPSLYQVNTRVLLTALSRTLGRPATLDDIPDAELDRIAGLGFDYVWLLSVRRTGSAGQRVSRAHAGWRHEFEDTLPDLCAEDIAGSGFAITGYTAHPAVGGTAALARTRRRRQARGLKLMLDFVPNHTALDHPWVEDHPDYYVGAGERHATARLHESGDAGGDDRRTAGDRRAVRRRALRHGDAGSAEDLRTHLGPATAPVLGAGHPAREEAGVRRASTTPTTGCARDTRGSCASTCGRVSTTRIGSRGSWRTTTSPGPPRRLRRGCTRPRHKRISPHLVRAPREPVDGQRLLVAVNYAGNQSQCYVRLPFADLEGHSVQLKDLGLPRLRADGAVTRRR